MPRTSSQSTSANKSAPTENLSQSLHVHPLTQTEPIKKTGAGRPAKLVMPPMPLMPMTEVEQGLFDFFQAAYKEQFPDLTPTDLLMLYLAGLEFVKYMRVVAEELETGKVISMARQHPGVNMRALLDQLSVTRKARVAKGKPEEDEDAIELRNFFMQQRPGKKQ